MEMVLMRDAVWSAVQEFRLPHEASVVDRLYDEFGKQPFTILLPSSAVAARGDAPLFERGRSVLHSIVERFLLSEEWSGWAAGRATAEAAAAARPAELQERDGASAIAASPPPTKANTAGPYAPAAAWDGWD